MKIHLVISLMVCFCCAIAQGEENIAARDATVEGVKLHYLTAGHGPAVILLHGYTQTSRMWKPLIPKLADKCTVIAPDLPGIGESEIPANGLDMKIAAIRVHALVKSLGVDHEDTWRPDRDVIPVSVSVRYVVADVPLFSQQGEFLFGVFFTPGSPEPR